MKNILLINDEPSVCDTLHRLLKLNKFNVTVATDGEKGLEAAHCCAPDIIIADLLLPKINGLVLCEMFRRHPKTKDIPIIFLSGLGREVLEDALLKAGANAYLTKPFDLAELLETINNLLEPLE